MPEFLARVRIKPTASFTEDGKPVFGFGEIDARDAERVLDDIYAMLGALSSQRPAVLVMDEFHAIADLGPGLAGVLKALGNEHPKVSLVIASSKRHLMDSLVISKGAPLYHMAERLALGLIDPSTLVTYLRSCEAERPPRRSLWTWWRRRERYAKWRGRAPMTYSGWRTKRFTWPESASRWMT